MEFDENTSQVCILTYPITLLLSAQMLERIVLTKFPSWAEKEESKTYRVIMDPSFLAPVSPFKNDRKSMSMYGASDESPEDIFELEAVELPLELELDDMSGVHGVAEQEGETVSPKWPQIQFPTERRSRGGSMTNAEEFHSPSRSFQVGLSSPDRQPFDDDEDLNVPKPNLLFRCCSRLVLVIITIIIAVSVPCFALVISLLGCCTVSILTYIMPPFIHNTIVTQALLRQSPELKDSPIFDGDIISPSTQNCLDYCYICFGFIFCTVSTTLTAWNMYITISGGGKC